VAAVTQGQSVAPLYFAFTADSNRRLRDLLDDAEPPAPLTVDELERLRQDATSAAGPLGPARRAQSGGGRSSRPPTGAVVIDGRSPESFASGHLRGSVNVGLDGRFAEYAGAVARPDQAIVVVTDQGRETEAKVRLARIGFDRVVGAVDDIERVLAEHPSLAERAVRLSAPDLAEWRDEEPSLRIVDVRNPGEQEGGVVPGAVRLPLARLLDRHDELDAAAPTVVYCAGGYRSSVAASLLRSLGFARVADLQGGYDAWTAASLPVETRTAT
jgi:rhodanese-related sulfurtransferase